MERTMQKYATKADLVGAYAQSRILDGIDSGLAYMIAADKPSYVPHIYNGGWFIRGFGYSTERVGVFVEPGRNLTFNLDEMRRVRT
jgi:hypothetical protein